MLDILAARRAVEDEIVRVAVRTATRDDLDALDEYLAARETGLEQGRQDVAGDLTFHAMLAEATGNRVLVSLVRHLNELWQRSREKTGRRNTSPHKAHQFHRQILSALRRRQGAAARRVMRRHLDNMKTEIEKYKG